MSRPGPHPGPPPDLLRRQVPVIEYADVLFRTHRRDREPVYFGATGRNRFDDCDGRD